MQLLFERFSLAEIVEKLQDDLAQERSEKASVDSSREMVETGTSPGEDIGSHVSFETNPATVVCDDANLSVADAETQAEDENPFANMEFTALVDELEETVRIANTSRLERSLAHWWSDLYAAVTADNTAAVALLLLVVWCGFSFVYGG